MAAAIPCVTVEAAESTRKRALPPAAMLESGTCPADGKTQGGSGWRGMLPERLYMTAYIEKTSSWWVLITLPGENNVGGIV